MLTPGDIANKTFDRKMGGYRTPDVDSFLAEVNLTVTQLNREIAELKRRADAAERKLASYESDEGNISQALLNAQRLSDSLVRDAQAKAEITLRDAEIKAGKIKERVKEAILEQQEEFTKTKNEIAEFKKRILTLYKEQVELIMETPDEGAEAASGAENGAETDAGEAPRPEEQGEGAQEPEPAAPAEPEAKPETPEPDPAVSSPAAAPEPAQPLEEKKSDFKLNLKFDEARGEYLPITDDPAAGKKQYRRFGDPDAVEDELAPGAGPIFGKKHPGRDR